MLLSALHEQLILQHMTGSESASSPIAASSTSLLDDHSHLSSKDVETYVDQLLQRNTAVKRLVESMHNAGCSIDRSYFKVTTCNSMTGGGFSLQHGVILCHNRLETYADVENAVIHELIHAYDQCRVPNMDFNSCRHHACTEVRAANLSGDCDLMQELQRGNLSINPSTWASQHQRCVERRAALSVALNPSCGGIAGAQQTVKNVLGPCIQDTSPLQEPSQNGFDSL